MTRNDDTHLITGVRLRQGEEQEMPTLALEDELGREIELAIGPCEAVAIQYAPSATNRPAIGRPLTHDLLLSIADHLESRIDHVIIDDLSNGIYYARLVVTHADGTVSLDCRPSDGIAAALRAKRPIYVTDAVMRGEEHEA